MYVYYIEWYKKDSNIIVFEQGTERSDGQTLQVLGKVVFQAERISGAKIPR